MDRASLLGFATCLAALAVLWSPPAAGQAAEAVDHSQLRVCADPNNLPFSNQSGEGFENKIAELIAAELGVPVRYTWYPDTMGFVRNTLHAHKCDLVMGTASGNELLQNTNPYYRTAFSLVYREDSGLAVASLDDPVLHTLEIGVVAGTPPSTVLAQNGLLARTHSYHLMADTRFEHPAENLVHDVEAGQIDVGIVWGPIAGYFAKQASVPLVVVPLSSEGSPVRLEYRITMGVRFNEPEWRRRINDLLRKKQAEINRILLDYGVPLMDERGQPITQ